MEGAPEVAVKAEKEVLEENKVLMKVEVPAEEIKKAIDRAFRDIAREVFIPGFRKGKAPRRVLQARLGMEAIYEEVKQSNLPDYFEEALEQLGIEPVGEPDIDVDEIEVEEGKPLVFEATMEIVPQVELEEYKGIEVEKPDEEVSEEEVDEALESMRDKFAQLEVASGKKLTEGDYALIDFTGTVNDQPFEGSSANDYMLELGSENIWPEFNQELKDKRKGDILDVKVKMPEQLPDEEMAGKVASFKVIVKEVKVKKLPEADDDFAKEASQFDTLQELKDDIRSKMEEAKKARAEEMVRLQVLEKLAESLEVDIPEKMVEDFSTRRRAELEARLASRGISLDSYLKAMDYTEKRMQEEFTQEAERFIRNEMVLDAVVQAEEMEVSDEELDSEIKKTAEMLNIAPEEYRKILEEREGLRELREELLHRNALKFLGEHAVFAGEGTIKDSEKESGTEEETSGESEEETSEEPEEETSEESEGVEEEEKG
jgi:trigger factor